MVSAKRVGLLVMMVITYTLILARPAAAQEGLEIDINRSVLTFPDTITFRLAARGQSNIEHITLTYGTNSRSCQSGGSRQAIQFESAQEIDVDWEWELKRSGSIPPGASIWWEWTLIDSDGNVHITDRQERLFLDDRYIWNDLSREEVTAHWFFGNNTFADETLTITLAELERIGDQIGVELSRQIQLWIYPTADDVRDALVISHDWAGAVAFPDYNIMIISLSPGEADWAAEVIPHELAHLIIGAASFNCRGGHLPIWLSEGLAKVAEGQADSTEMERLEDALQEENLPPLASLADGFSAYGGAAGQAYAQSGEVVRYLIEQHGVDQVSDLLEAIRDGQTIDQSLEQVYGFDTNGLDARWRVMLGYAPTPTSAAVDAMNNATPTLVPTLALLGPPIGVRPSETSSPVPITPQPTRSEPTKTPPPSTGIASLDLGTDVPTATPASLSTPDETTVITVAESESRPNLILWALVIGISLAILATVVFMVLRKGE
jgi:hypothetical protein